MPKVTSAGASNAQEETQAVAAPPVADAPAAEAAAPAAPAPVAQEETAAEGAAALPPVASMSKAELQDHADSLGLATDGTKADLAARIVEHHETAGAAGAPDAGPEA